MTHDPIAALEVEPLPNLSPWESLAQQARWLADLADRSAAAAPADLAPTDDDDDPRDVLAELDERALAIRSVVAACRRVTWQALHDAGHSYAEIGRMWGVTRGAVSAALTAPGRSRR